MGTTSQTGDAQRQQPCPLLTQEEMRQPYATVTAVDRRSGSLDRLGYARARGGVELPSFDLEIAEIETAVKRVRAHGLHIAEIRREDFPLPTLGPVIDRLRAEVLDGRGFVLVRGLPVEDRPIAESATAYWGIGTYSGSARSQNAQGHLLGHVYDLGKGLSATNPNLRSYATAERQNFHIDRCDVVALLCLRRAKSGGLSSIVSSMAVHNVMAQRRPDLLERLYQPFPVDRRGEVPEGKAPFYEAPVFNK
jgi:Taurine catabolism dioxygenase TauD, TfdA family